MKTVIFACVQNAGRSQMAAAFFNRLRHLPTVESQLPRPVQAISAGTAPAERVHPEVVEVMREVGIDLSLATPQKLTAELAQTADLLVTMGCGDECPYVPGLKVEDWPLDDPKGKPAERVREIRDDIRARVHTLFKELTALDTNGR
jgi:arsenate reductase